MVGISWYDSNSIQTLFSSLNSGTKSTTSSSLFNINLADYASIRSGSYGKLLKSYYAEAASSSDSTTKSKTSTSTAKEKTAKLARIEDKSEDLKEAADVLLKKGNSSVFVKKSTTDEAGHVTSSYDTDKIYKAVKEFTDKYNSAISEAEDSSVSGVTRAYSSMVNMTEANESLLNKIGITINDDNQLEIDEKAFKEADMTAVKSLFNTTGAYGYQVSAQASLMDFHAQNEASKSNTYTSSGMYTYNYNTGEIYNSEV